ncbi:hypothetical protein [Gimesia algae]|uniref:Uncharacterized protein n=1 Tax=Gimesia algae TaxID=2527971 RepID=A0A517VAX9_9PLAN|nr:hypothetical protein [Gimesia algae]QDT90160.1 hypothetical protein Pan161_18100 [Gimesia algae]
MLKVNVGMSRKISRDYNSTGFSVNLEGEILANLDDPEAIVERVKEFYDHAEESLAQQIERYEGETAISQRDMDHSNANGNHRPSPVQTRIPENTSPTRNGNGHSRMGNSDSSTPATNKQIQFLLSLGKRQGLAKPQLENHIAGILGHEVDVYELTKDEAGKVLNHLTEANNGNKSVRR